MSVLWPDPHGPDGTNLSSIVEFQVRNYILEDISLFPLNHEVPSATLY
jgi:hypothetical protein